MLKIDNSMGKKILYFLSFLLVIILLSISLKWESLIGMTSAIILFLVFVCFVKSHIYKIEKRFVPIIFLVLLLMFYLVRPFSPDTIVSCVLFLSMVSIWPSFKLFKIDKLGGLILIYLLVFLIIFYLSSSANAYRGVYNFGDQAGVTYNGEYLTLGFNNPNEAGMILYFVITIFICFIIMSAKTLRFILLIPLIYLVYLLYKTGCRSCLTSLILVSLFYYFNRNNFSILSNKTVIMILLMTPILFAILYPIAAIYYANADLEILGKPIFSGRDYLFTEELANFWKYPLFGNISGYRFTNALNGYLTIMFNTGLFGLTIYLVSIYSVLKSLTKEITSQSQFFAYLSIIGAYFIASSESVLLVGGGRWYIFMLTLFVLASNKVQETNIIFSRKTR